MWSTEQTLAWDLYVAGIYKTLTSPDICFNYFQTIPFISDPFLWVNPPSLQKHCFHASQTPLRILPQEWERRREEETWRRKGETICFHCSKSVPSAAQLGTEQIFIVRAVAASPQAMGQLFTLSLR